MEDRSIQRATLYAPLDDSRSAVRIITILPELSDGFVQTSLQQVYLPARYICLSYCWGEPQQGSEILVNNIPVRVRSNLHNFLASARHWLCNEPIWVDALCINQDDHGEKGHQVQMMGSIYQGATEVLVWLGLKPDLDDMFDFTQELRKQTSFLPSTKAITDYIGPFAAISQLIKENSKRLHQSMTSLNQNPYWERTWIAQEILMAHYVRVTNGNRVCEWGHLVKAVTELCNPRLRAWNVVNESPRQSDYPHMDVGEFSINTYFED
jgi:hypothetical protein